MDHLTNITSICKEDLLADSQKSEFKDVKLENQDVKRLRKEPSEKQKYTKKSQKNDK